jgi:hypothetical protein
LGGISDTFTPLSLIYLFGAGYTVFQMAKGWRQFRSGQLTTFNRRLASGIAFFLLVPVGVLLPRPTPFRYGWCLWRATSSATCWA